MADLSKPVESATWLYLGNFMDLDTTVADGTGNGVAENAQEWVDYVYGITFTSSNGLRLQEVIFSGHDTDEILATNDNIFASYRTDAIAYSTDSTSYHVDSVIRINITIIYEINGVELTVSGNVAAIQLTNGDILLAATRDSGGKQTLFDNLGTITGITVNYLVNNDDTEGDELIYHDTTIIGTTISSPTSIISPANISPANTNFTCFSAETLIETANGSIPVGNLTVGDLVWTKDNGLQPVRWVGRKKLLSEQLALLPNIHPIRIRAGALGDGVPTADLVVSPQHRILVRSNIAQKMFDTCEVLVAAKHLLQVEGIDIATDLDEVEYVHILFDQHEVVVSNGAETESLYTGQEALKSVGVAALKEIYTLFPKLRYTSHVTVAARPLVRGQQGRKLAVRHVKNGKPLVMQRSDAGAFSEPA